MQWADARQFVTIAALQNKNRELSAKARSYPFAVSKQLAISAAFSVFAMTAFVLFATPSALGGQSGVPGAQGMVESIAGAPIEIEAPANLPQLPQLPKLPFLAD